MSRWCGSRLSNLVHQLNGRGLGDDLGDLVGLWVHNRDAVDAGAILGANRKQAKDLQESCVRSHGDEGVVLGQVDERWDLGGQRQAGAAQKVAQAGKVGRQGASNDGADLVQARREAH